MGLEPIINHTLIRHSGIPPLWNGILPAVKWSDEPSFCLPPVRNWRWSYYAAKCVVSLSLCMCVCVYKHWVYYWLISTAGLMMPKGKTCRLLSCTLSPLSVLSDPGIQMCFFFYWAGTWKHINKYWQRMRCCILLLETLCTWWRQNERNLEQNNWQVELGGTISVSNERWTFCTKKSFFLFV